MEVADSDPINSGDRRQARQQPLKGAQVAKRLYAEQGLDVSRILFESESRNTSENATLSKVLAKPAPGETW
ncbi:MAG: YdcF family protein, partial [Actinomycetia bacterium]|nr:YdcF family protein [Actinomycetes bacterium]